MSEIRISDPTLDALDEDVLVTWWSGDGPPAVAHRFAEHGNAVVANCGWRPTKPYPLGSEDVRWFAVPCRECFPDAPPPGREFYFLMDQRNRVKVRTRPVKGLAWQVQP